MVHLIKLLSRSPEETTEIGKHIGGRLSRGDVVALSGSLGSGKSVIARGILRALGVTGDLPSPSFVMIAAYEGRVAVNHIDLYRLGSPREAVGLGLEEAVFSDSVSVIEWAEKVEDLLPPNRLLVLMEPGRGPEERVITIRARDEATGERLMPLVGLFAGFGDENTGN